MNKLGPNKRLKLVLDSTRRRVHLPLRKQSDDDGVCSKEPSPVTASWAIEHLPDLVGTPFGEMPIGLRREVYGVPYVQLEDTTGGRLWVTCHGWHLLQYLDPANWYFGGQYSRRGQRLSEGSGAVYRVSHPKPQGRSVDLVVKFSRMAQEVSLQMASSCPGNPSDEVVETAAFNDPFQEFGLLEELRGSTFGPSQLRILTKRPLAIYSPARTYEPWQLGRSEDRFRPHRHELAKDQASRKSGFAAVELSIQRQYVCLFHWVHGDDAQQLQRRGVISPDELTSLVTSVVNDLSAKGFRVLDTKPNHIILRHRAGKTLLRRGGRTAFAIVDFELLQRTEEYEGWCNSHH